MSQNKCKYDFPNCKTQYLSIGVVVVILWLVAATILWFLRKRRKTAGTEQDSKNPTHEMTQVRGNKDSILIYSSIDFIGNNDKTTKKRDPEDEITYAQIKNTEQENEELVYTAVKFNERGKHREKPPNNSAVDATYAEVKLTGPSQGGNDSADLYASVVKKKSS